MNQAGYQSSSRLSDHGLNLNARVPAFLALQGELSQIEALRPLKGFMDVKGNVSGSLRQKTLSSGTLSELFQAIMVRPIQRIKSRFDVNDKHRNLRAGHQPGHS